MSVMYKLAFANFNPPTDFTAANVQAFHDQSPTYSTLARKAAKMLSGHQNGL